MPSAVKARSTHAAMCEMLGDMSDMRGDDGLAIDGLAIGRPLSRRRALGLALVGAGSVLAGGAPLPLVGPRLARAAGGCVVRPALTEGPYFVDEKLDRSDIRSDPADGTVRPGAPLRLALRVSRLTAGACAPLPGATVDVWHCDAQGAYSDVGERDGRAIGQKFLRGYQVTDRDGLVRFTTIYPGWYEGRTVHIHFKIRAAAGGGRAHEFTSQLFFDDALTDQVLAQAPYATRGARRVRNPQDGIYRAASGQLTLTVAPTAPGYLASLDLALETG